MRLNFGDISNLFLVITAVIAWFSYTKYKSTPLKYLPIYLTYAAILENVANILLTVAQSNTWWYNIGINIEILFFLHLYYNYIKNKKNKKFLLICAIIYEVYFLINVFILESWNDYQVFPFTVGGIFIIIFVFAFLLEMFQSSKILHTQKYLIFWISLGVLFYNIIPLPLFVTRSILSNYELSQMMVIQYLANIIMYLLFIYGFIWSSMKYK
ncbi:MAG TPA: hypothetical protein EYG92_09110 [Lutibacter sp.]|nr:hypothetical protein [Lutibacter sp.]